MAIDMLDKSACVGCGACMQICPQKCIRMKEDECGFYYPNVDRDVCVKCNMCEKVCPIISVDHNLIDRQSEYEKIAYAAWSKSKDIRWVSTSGGVFSEIAAQVVTEGGYICGAEYESPKYVRHSLYNHTEGICRLQQSKYTQSYISDIYSQIQKILNSGTKVLFCGTPCQVAGLHTFLRKKYDNLICVDFICRGVNSPKAYKMWVDEIERKEKKQVTKVWFKYKCDGWKKSPFVTRVDFADNSVKVFKGNKNAFMLGYLSLNLFIRPSCGECRFKNGRSLSDITLGDFWGIDSKFDDDNGTSLVLVNSAKGEKLLEKLKNNMELHIQMNTAYTEGNSSALSSVRICSDSENFLRYITEADFSKKIYKMYKKKRGNIVKRIYRRLVGETQ